MTDIKLAYDTITGKVAQHTTNFNYYDGLHPLVFANERLRDVFAGVQVQFTENWCAVVIDAVKDRIQLEGLEGADQAALDNLWSRNDLALEGDDLHEAVLVTGEGYLIAWPNDAGQAEIYYNDPRLCHVFYEADNPRVARMAAKLWITDDGSYRMILYYPDWLEYYKTSGKAENISTAAAFVIDEDAAPGGVAENPYEQIPVFHFRLNKRRLQGDLANVVPIQNGVNKLLTDMMVAAEYGAFKQRWIISNADVGTLKNSPNQIWGVPAGDGVGQQTSIGEFSATDLDNYLGAVEQLAGDLARISRTPKHYLFAQGGDPSGEALIAMEAPLTAKVQDRIERFDPVWRRAVAFALQIDGAAVDPGDLKCKWREVQIVQPKTQAEIRLTNTQAGIPIVTQLREDGWTDEQLAQMQVDKSQEQASQAAFGDQLLGNFEKGQV